MENLENIIMMEILDLKVNIKMVKNGMEKVIVIILA